ncbi:phosphoglycerate dehydrogenase-like enzyme [Comamonas sp. BIGb0124]|uniref:2-hydroxyacid dehydrogenase n=1 Tax=Comamonas sp. BIGb0124 TaxID=2485130 RepID=UPI000F495F5C|nr:2-hydroxyacid dehydrogenase [Comamonas sp. BIGb0124]ROR18051.1 phosphoglycerate dehydrogenase-like enzyme [Comamonas sp. BIGb0124]
MHILIAGLHAPHAPRLQSLLGPEHRVEGIPAFADSGEIAADVVVCNQINPQQAARLRCRLLQVPGAGWEQIACEALPAGLPVSNVHGHEVPIAEFTLHAVLEHQLQLWKYPSRLDAQAWAEVYKARPQHDEAWGKTLVLVGFGHIGQEIARRARAFGMRVVAVTRSGRAATEGPAAGLADETVAVAELASVLPRAQALVLCCPLDDSTRGLIGARQLALMPPGALLVNVARAEVVDEEALYHALTGGQLGRAALDVWYSYPKAGQTPAPPSRWPLHELPNVRGTPHISAITPALLERRYAFIAHNTMRVAQGLEPENVIYRSR